MLQGWENKNPDNPPNGFSKDQTIRRKHTSELLAG